MKKFFLLAFVLGTSLAQAAEVTVLEADISGVDTFYTSVDTSFQMDKTTGEGFAQVVVYENQRGMGSGYYDPSGRWYPFPNMPVAVYKNKIKVDGLSLVNDQVFYQGETGEVLCGKMGLSRILRKPTLFLNGNCKLLGSISGNWNSAQVLVKLKTK